MNIGGYAGRVGWIDLSTGTVEYRVPTEDELRKYLGGRGLGVKYLSDAGAKVDPLGEDSLAGLFVGPLTGTDAPMSGRIASIVKSPLTGTISDSHAGGTTGATLKWAGFDGLVFRGKATHPTYAVVKDGKVELEDARELWGKDTAETTAALKARYGDKANVVCVGPAGEHGVKFACLIDERGRANGRGGHGAVWGSKNLKAVVLIGDRTATPQPANPELFRKARTRTFKQLAENGVTNEGLPKYGTDILINVINGVGGLPTRNAQEAYYAGADAIGGERMADTILVRRGTCFNCPVGCKRYTKVEGRYEGEGPEYETCFALGSMCGNFDLPAIGYMNHLCNLYGLDTISLGNTLAIAMEATQRGLISDGINFGDTERMVELIHQIVSQEGIGEVLGLGEAGAANAFGDPDLAMAVKGMGIPAYDPRAIKGIGLNYATSNRGACHVRGYTIASEVMGIPEQTDRLAYAGKAQLVITFQDLTAAIDSLDCCLFSSFALSVKDYADLLSGMTGWEIDEDELMRTGERIYNLERHYNNLLGFAGKDDTLPNRLLHEPIPDGPSKGEVCALDKMLPEYYRLRGWENGIVPEEKLRELGIE